MGKLNTSPKWFAFSSTALLCLLVWQVSPAQADSAPAAEITFAQSSNPVSINRMLLGSQFTYFDVPVFQRLENESLLKTWKEIPLGSLRYPGGTWGDHYLWDNPSGGYFAAGSASTIVTPERFIRACRTLGCEPILQVNTGSKGGDNNNRINPTKLADIQAGARNAANWVREANLKNKWNVKYWEIGNEVWIWMTPEEYARFVVEYSKAMKAVDPSIKIIACGLSGVVGPFNITWLKFKDDPDWVPRTALTNNPEDWNRALFTGAKDAFDYYAPHPYLTPKDYDASKMSNKQIAQAVSSNSVPHYLATVAAVWECAALKEQQELAAKYKSTARLAVTEWNCNNGLSVSGSSSWGDKLYFYSLGNGLNNAHYFGRILEGAGVTDIATLHSLEEIQTFYYWPRKQMVQAAPIQSPTYLAMKVWGQHLGKLMLNGTVKHMPELKIGGKVYPTLFAYGSEDESAVYVVAINLDQATEHELVIRLQDMPGMESTAAGMWMTGAGIDANNFASFNNENPPAVKLSSAVVSGDQGKWAVKMPAHSMVGLTIRKK